jgi:hypothetical protein
MPETNQIFRDEQDQQFMLVMKDDQLRRKYIDDPATSDKPFRNLSELDAAKALGDLPGDATSTEQMNALIAASKLTVRPKGV